MPKTILITGASTGFGRDTAETLARAGHTVFASMRDPKAKNSEHAAALRKLGIEIALQGYVEAFVARAGAMERQIQRLLDQRIQVGCTALAGAAA